MSGFDPVQPGFLSLFFFLVKEDSYTRSSRIRKLNYLYRQRKPKRKWPATTSPPQGRSMLRFPPAIGYPPAIGFPPAIGYPPAIGTSQVKFWAQKSHDQASSGHLLPLPPKAYLVASESFRCISSYMSTLKVLCTKDRAIFKASTRNGGQRSAINCSRSMRIRPL